jgi:fucose 4-O-acetylase-like acetyltransferase
MVEKTHIIDNKRINHIDTAKCIGIFLMILGHSGITGNIMIYIYAFHMPLFFILSGYITNENTSPFIYFSIKRIKTLLVPFLCFALIFSQETYSKWIYIFYGSRNSLAIANTFTPLWFLSCLFSSVIIYQLIINISNKYYRKRKIYYWTFIVIVIMLGYLTERGTYIDQLWNTSLSELGYPFCFNIAMVGVVFMAIGRAISKITINFLFKMILIPGLLAVSLYTYKLNLPLDTLFGISHVEMCIAVYGNYFFFFFNAIILSYVIILISSFISNKIVEFLGRNSLLILIGSAITLPISEAILTKFNMGGGYLLYYKNFIGVHVYNSYYSVN